LLARFRHHYPELSIEQVRALYAEDQAFARAERKR
jgi:hypothetical protein